MFLINMKGHTPKLLYKTIVYKLLFCETPFEFQKILSLIMQGGKDIIGGHKVEYLKKLVLIKEKWARSYCPYVFIAGTHTTS